MASDPRNDPSAFTKIYALTKNIHRSPQDVLSPKLTDNSQRGKIIVITGGGSGIGAVAAEVWAQAHAEGVVITGRRKDVIDRKAADLSSKYPETEIFAVQADVASESDMKNVFDRVKKEFGRTADVVLANAAMLEFQNMLDIGVNDWWKTFDINVFGLHNTVVNFIRSHPDPKNPTGTLIEVGTGLAARVQPLCSAYAISKLAAQRYIEYLEIESPSLRAFSIFPGVVLTDSLPDTFKPWAHDDASLSGHLSLYLASERSDYLRNSTVSVNWDIKEMEAAKERIQKDGLLKLSWLPILPLNGGSGL